MWKNELKKCIRSVDQLKNYVDIAPEQEKRLKRVVELHPMRITPYYMSLIDWNDPADPIRKMIVPSVRELDLSGSYDTSGEKQSTMMPGLQHKYPQTVLILSTNMCYSYCRYCFRKRMVGLPGEEILKRIRTAIDYIREHSEINNVLVSGGDPFTLPTGMIGEFLEELSTVEHLKFVRFGSKAPVTFPDRIIEDRELIKLLKAHSRRDRRIFVVTQFNHPREITARSTEAVDLLIRNSIIVNNQTVLLKGVNDNPQVLADLQNDLVGTGVNPYYLFHCRPVKRIKRSFQVTLARGVSIVEDAGRMLNGHSKRFKYVMSHKTGKIEILGVIDGYIYFKYHEARNPARAGRCFRRKLTGDACWLDDLKR